MFVHIYILEHLMHLTPIQLPQLGSLRSGPCAVARSSKHVPSRSLSRPTHWCKTSEMGEEDDGKYL